ncbi:tyrosine-type recombinase/integrase [Gorillibacterium timonense]|uniref:tyrosine-type recombinase/integrase n=1 Tax=Gorillibacterium timonense TaxID=1689269 RepID=UPI00071C24B5|nr:site-specific integrase [Gorillibacterium timonense]
MSQNNEWDGIFFQSEYFEKWYHFVELKQDTKRHAMSHFKAFQNFLEKSDFEGELDFNQFYYSEYTGNSSPIDEEFIDNFIEYLQKETNYSLYSIYNIISYLKNFFRFLFDMEMIENNPMENYKNRFYHRPAVDKSLSIEECTNLLTEALKLDPFFRMYFTMIWVMLTCGLRNREIVMLKFDKINFDSNMIFIDEGQKTFASSVAIPPFLANELRRLINHAEHVRWRLHGNDQLFFFENRPLTKNKLSSIIHQLCKDAGIDRRVTPHDFRRTTGYLMQLNGASVI